MRPLDLTIRDATEKDLSALDQTLPGGDHSVQLANARAGRRDLLVACADGEPVGTAVVRWAGVADGARELGGTVPEIGSVAVSAAWRGQGIGRDLIGAAEARVRAREYDRAALLVAVQNDGARRLYARLGYTDTGLRRHGELVLTRRL